MDKSFIHVPVLRTADDLPAWRRAVRLLCLSHDVWGNVTGNNVRPDDPALVLVRCDQCEKVGHLKARCWKYQKDLKLKRKNAKPSSAKDVALLVSEESVSASDEEEEF